MKTPQMKAATVRQSFLDFFQSKGHRIIPSAPVIPVGDPTLMFTNAGMNQFKDVFLGVGRRDYVRVANSQKCIRVSGKHNDLEEVGRDTYHHTFFEMLGNWSFGDYYKREAIAWAWELLTEVWHLPKERLWATVFREDDEAAELWPQVTDIDPAHVLRFGEKDNFWEMGDTGPCGPCSEVHIDRGPEFCDSSEPGHVCGVNGGCARFLELWNLVFIQYNRGEDGVCTPLPAKHVDTGAGLERLVAVLQGKRSNYDTDLFMPLIEAIAERTGKSYSGGSDEQAVAFRVIADHVRALSFAIADGALPSNEGRGYVLRRLLRRAARFGRVLEMHEPFIFTLVAPLVDMMGEAYPELRARHQHIARVIRAEEENFSRTLDRGLAEFEKRVEQLLAEGQKVLPGEDAFRLHDTYGFPLDLTQLLARERGLAVDVEGFNAAMEEQRSRSRAAAAEAGVVIPELAGLPSGGSRFVGYETLSAQTRVVYADAERVVLETTPFYAESGGQVGDTGWIAGQRTRFRVENTVRSGDHIVHLGHWEQGAPFAAGDEVEARVDEERRRATERNHTATHLLHKALRTVLGDHAHQAGSLVHPDYLRFDFNHFEKLSAAELEQIEEMVNQAIQANYPVRWEILPFAEAQARGAVALFGEKYEDMVRMLEVDDYSRELCGGTHVRATGEIGVFSIVSESAVAAGVRRIEALTGQKAVERSRQERELLRQAAQVLSCQPDEMVQRLEALLRERKELLSAVKSRKGKDLSAEASSLVARVQEIEGIRLVTGRVQVSDLEELKSLADMVRDRLGSGAGVLFANVDGKGNFVAVVTPDLADSNRLHAGTLVREVGKLTGSGGGGGARMAQAGAKDLSRVDQALAAVPEIVARLLRS
ncbi:MAG: alanine--tRNA ligase [candidate division KSB1 bacterium]|nr:alanine--tRNA ligase [candidate division KSB1 bacterium]MDZ7413029.1 alanine--tRNA ligase [candidate division KSB1 bacterium]